MRYDVVVIGSGLGGLECALLLCKAGRSVLVLERQSQPGGCMQRYCRKVSAVERLSFDTGLHYVGGLDVHQSLYEAFDRLGLLSLPWQRLDPAGFDRVTIGGQTFCFAEGFERFADTLARDFPHERRALEQYVRELQTHGFDDANAYDYLTTLFRDPLLVNVLGGTALKTEPRRASLPLFSFAHSQKSYIESSWRLKGGGSSLVDQLVGQIRALGGTVVCGAEVTELLCREGKISAARCTDGACYEGDAFVSDVHPSQTFSWIKDNPLVRPLFRRRITQLSNTWGVFTVSLVLKPGCLSYFNHNKYVYRQANVWETPTATDRLMISAYIPESGTSLRQIDLLTPMLWSRLQPWTESRVGHRGDDYRQLKEQVADECIALAETVIPGLGSMVEQRFTSTPLTWRDYTLTPEGSAYGIRKESQRLMMTMLSPRTPVPNLLLTGQNVGLHGVEGVTMTAFQTTQELLKL
ncbi:MAG: NAD(P)/FAD-dependent oxidoreductase [Prevotella sp.]|nr:NAD(P)/FAD-dependent oxidoreductase [Prevotella sp.]